MKIDRSKIKKGTSEVPHECNSLIEKLKACSTNRKEFLACLKQVKSWNYGKCELYHWADILDLFDVILEESCHIDEKDEAVLKWTLPCDLPGHEEEKQLVLQVLQFTSLLIEHSFTRHLYNSMEHLTALMSSSDMTVVLGVLNLLYVFSKRSNFITRLGNEKKQALVIRLTHLAESWGGKENGFGLAECCQNLPQSEYPCSATTLHFEFYGEQKEEKSKKKNMATVLSTIHVDSVDKVCKLAGQMMEELLATYSVPDDKKILLFTHIRLAQSFSSYDKRMQCVHARLLAISILVYSRAMQENVNGLLYNGFVEELVDILELKDDNLVDIKAAALRTLTSIIHLDRNPKLQNIIDATGASLYHGFLPVLVRTCILHMTDTNLDPFPQAFATSLFSFLYHLASYESGGDALVACGMMESLLKVVNWFGEGQEHITFVTRAVRVVDLITNLDMQAFQTHSGLQCFINRLEHEVCICRKEQPFVIAKPKASDSSHQHMDSNPTSPAPRSAEPQSPLPSSGQSGGQSDAPAVEAPALSPMDTTAVNEGASTSDGTGASVPELTEPCKLPNGKVPHCFPQRAALLKSMLNFLKKAIPDPSFSDSIRHLMDGSLPSSLKHVISNAEYYGPSLFLLATDVVTVYVYQEPSLLSSLQDLGLTDVVLHALLVRDVPATREVLSSLPNVFSALCLNARGLESFVQCKPFERLFKVLLSPDYLPAMRRRRSSDPPGETASSLGSAMDELMRHQPSLKTEATKAIIKLLEKICALGTDERYICQKPQSKTENASRINISITTMGNDGDSSDEEEEEEEVGGTEKDGQGESESRDNQQFTQSSPEERKPIPLMDYVLNVMKFVEAILSNNTTDDHCREFIAQKGLEPLMKILGLPNLPIEFPTAPSCQAVSSVCKSVLTLAHEVNLLKEGLKHLNSVLDTLEGFYKFMDPPGGSILIKELVAAQCDDVDPTLVYSATPLLHGLTQVHAYVAMFSHVCKVGQTDIRTMSVNQWGSAEGLQALAGLSKLYSSLVWESTILLSFCSEDTLPADCDFGKKDLEKLIARELKSDAAKEEKDATKPCEEMGSNGVSAAMESLSTHDSPGGLPMETDSSKSAEPSQEKPEDSSSQEEEAEKKEKKLSPQKQAQLKQIKPLLNETSKLGKALAELFGLLVKLSVGSPVRQRRTQISATPTMPSAAAKEVARAITKLLASGLTWEPPQWTPVPKLRLTFYICSVGFISPMLFDEKKFPYHLMLQKFVACGGQDAMFDTFRWALTAGGQVPPSEGLEYDRLPDGTGEFLDAWLILMERMVNVKQILESPHSLPNKPPTFSPLQFLISTHKMAFETVMFLWGKTPLKPLNKYGRWMSESILAILCHIIKGESVIKEKLEKEKETEASNVSGPSSTPAPSTSGVSSGQASSRPTAPAAQQQPVVNQEHLQQLMDMGFTREHAVDSLQNTTSLEQATEYILTHPPPAPTSTAPTTSSVPQVLAGMDIEGGSDEEQILRAIAMSLGESMAVLQGVKPPEEKKEPEETPEDTQRHEVPLDKEVIDQFTETMFSGCMQLLDAVPECVYKVCDLLSVITARNGNKWRENILTVLVKEVADFSLKLMEAASPMTTSDTRSVLDWANQLSSMEEATKLAARLHLLTLLFEEMKLSCAEVVEESGILDILTRLLDQGQRCFLAVKEASTPKWVAPLVLLLDLYEKMSIGSKRRADLEKIVGKKHVWKWFDDRSGRWCNYSNSNNKTIDDAYVAGDSSIRFTAGRRRYTVQFGTMIQVNEETGNRRPIMLSLPSKEEPVVPSPSQQTTETNNAAPTSTTLEHSISVEVAKMVGDAVNKDEATMETEDYESKEPAAEKPVMKGLMPDNIASIIRSTVGLIGKPVDPETLHAVMRLTLRLTREHQFAAEFAELGGTKLILKLTQNFNFQGVTSLATLIFRHVMEEPTALRHTVEKVIRASTTGAGSSSAGVGAGSIGSKEINYVLRVLSPVACRDPALFTEVAKSCLRIALPPFTKREEDDARLLSSNTPQVLKCLPSKQTVSQSVDGHIKNMLQDLLNALTHTYTKPEEMDSNLHQALQEVIQDATSVISVRAQGARQGTSGTFQRVQNERVGGAETVGGSSSGVLSDKNKDPDKPKEEDKTSVDILSQQPLLPKSALLRLLAELVRSYAGCAQLITSHMYCSGQDGTPVEECSALAFILDNLLPQCQESGDKDCPALAKVLIASLAASNHSPDAQSALVGEMKSALQRALMLPESTEKHSKLQALTALVSTVIDSCPVPGQIQNQVFKGQQNTMNNMVKLLLKKGLVTDLARIPHSLDLSSPSMASTMNTVLRPLETLSRIVNQPQTISSTKGSKAKTPQDEDLESTFVIQGNAGQASETTDGGTRTDAQTGGNVTIEVQGNLQNTDTGDPTRVGEAPEEAELESVLDDLLQRDTTANAEDEVLGEIVVETMAPQRQSGRQGDNLRMLVGVDVDQDDEDEDDDDDNHDSQMVTQEISDVEDDTDDNTHDAIDEGGSDAEVDHDVEDEDDHEGNTDDDEDDDNDEDDDDDEEDDDDDDGSDMEGDEDVYDDDNYFQLREDDDLYVQLEDGGVPDAGIVMSNTLGGGASIRNFHTLPIAMHDQDNGNSDPAGPSVPPAPSTVTASHPLLIRQADTHGITNSFAGRLRGMPRNRGFNRYNPNAMQTLQVQYVHDAARVNTGGMGIRQNTLLQNLFQRSTALPAHFTFVSQNDNRTIEDLFENMFQDPFYEMDGGSSGILSNVPSALTRWTEEAKVLDGDTVHDCVTLLKPDIITELELHRDKELAERKEKRKKLTEEEAKKEKDRLEKESKTSDENKTEKKEEASGETEATGADDSAARDEESEEDKTIEWGTPPEGPLPTTMSQGNTSQQVSSATDRSNSMMTNSQDLSIQGIAFGNRTTDTIPDAERAFLQTSDMSGSLQLSGISISAPSSQPAVVTTSSMLFTGGTMPAQPPPPVLSTPAAPNILRNFTNALGLGFSDAAISASMASTPALVVTESQVPSVTSSTAAVPMDTTSTSSSSSGGSVLSNMPPPSQPDPIPSRTTPQPYPHVREIPLPSEPEPAIPHFPAGLLFRPGSGTAATGHPLSEHLFPGPLSELLDVQHQVTGSSVQIDSSQSETQATGTITPPQPSDITSSDNVTVNSSPISTEPNSVNDTDTPSIEQPATSGDQPAAVVTSAVLPPSSSLAGASSSVPQASGSAPGFPDGVDPSFLAALPEAIRQEVIAEQLRLQRIQQRAQEQQQQAQQLGVAEVNPEFLAALPPNIQEEVLAQQRAEQARLAAETSQTEGQESTMDPATFISSLPASLRTQVLADMDDSMVAVLPPDLATEANMLRRELEDRHRRIMQERLFNQGSDPLSALMRHTGLSGRIPSRYTVRPPTRGGDHHHWLFGRPRQNQGGTGFSTANTVKLRGRHLLDHEALACLLVMLFVDEPRLNSARLHRVLRNLCYHAPTRAWVIRALLSILHRTSECKNLENEEGSKVSKSGSDKLKKKSSQNGAAAGSGTSLATNLLETPSRSGSDLRLGQPSWLSISMDAALGCRANVFQVHRGHGKKTTVGGTVVGIHPQASPVVSRHVLDALISLAKSFPNQFLPQTKAKEAIASGKVSDGVEPSKEGSESRLGSQQTSPAKSVSRTDSRTESSSAKGTTPETDFWELLIKLDSQTSGKKGKNIVRSHVNQTLGDDSVDTSFENAPLGLLMAMLAHPVLRRSQMLTDRLLRLLGLISVGIPDMTKQQNTSAATSTTTTVSTAATTTASITTVASTSTVMATSVISSTLDPNSLQERSQQNSREATEPASPQPSTDPVSRTDETLNETMDISAVPDEHLQTSTPLPGKKEDKVDEKAVAAEQEEEELAVLPLQLQLAVQVLTSKSCSEEGLEDATNLLMQLSRANSATRDMVLYLLLAGARDLGLTVCTHIRLLLKELKDLNLIVQDNGDEEKEETTTPPQKDSPTDRFTGVVINAPSKVKKSGRELQLPSMNLMTNKTSSQQFLLRILKVIIQLREAAKNASKKNKKIAEFVSETMALLEAEAETVMELVQGERQRAGTSSGVTTTTAASVPRSVSQSITQAGVTQRSAPERPEAPMDVDQPGPSTSGTTGPLEVDTKSSKDPQKPDTEEEAGPVLPRLSEQLLLEELWDILGECLTELAKTPDHHAVLVLQPAVEAFFLVHAGEKEDRKKDGTSQKREDQLSHLNADITAPMSPAASYHDSQIASSSITGVNRQDSVMSSSVISVNLPPDTQKFLRFAETHRTVLNQILRQSTSHLSEGPFSVLVDHTRILDFDVKRRYFRHELERMDEGRGMRREDLAVHVKREHVFEDSFRELLRKSKDDWKHRFYIVFEGEEGQDAGGLLREWYLIMSREIFNPDYVLFRVSPGDRVTYTINPSSHYNSNHLSYFKFVGRFLAKAIYDNKLLECYFTRSFYKHILGKPVRYTDMEAEDYSFYQGLVFLMEHNVEDLGYELTFSTEIQEFGVTQTRDLKPNGRDIQVTEETKREYVKFVCQERMTGAIRQQLNSFLEGFYEIIPKRLISIFNEQELELLMSGLPTIDIDDLKANTEYHKYQANSLQIQWFWRALRSFDQTDRAAFLQFVTGTSKVPLQGFAFLEGMNGTQKLQIHRDDRSTDRLPCAHTCFNQLDLPAYETYTKLREMLLLSVHECSEGFGLA